MRNVNKIILISIAAHILICYTIVFGLYKLIRNRGKKIYQWLYCAVLGCFSHITLKIQCTFDVYPVYNYITSITYVHQVWGFFMRSQDHDAEIRDLFNLTLIWHLWLRNAVLLSSHRVSSKHDRRSAAISRKNGP